MDYRTLRKYVRDHPDAIDFLERQTQDTLDQSHSKLIAAAPAAAQRLIDLINDENNRGCLLYTSPSPRDPKTSRMPSSA